MPYLSPPTRAAAGQPQTISLDGDWSVMALDEIDREIAAINLATLPSTLVVDGSGIDGLDLSSAAILVNWLKKLEARQIDVRLENMSDGHRRLMDLIVKAKPAKTERKPEPNGLFAFFANIGHAAENIGREGIEFTAFTGRIAATFFRLMLRPHRIRWTSIVFHMYEVGFRAIPIVALMSFLIAIVTGYQGIVQLRQFGAEIYTINLVAISMLRELAVLVTAIMVAGRSGSAFTAELGVMKTNEEVDALRTMGMDVFEVLVLPRIIAIVIVLPLLAIVADFCGLIGGFLIAKTSLDVSLTQYLDRIHEFVKLQQFWLGLLKAPFFAFTIGMVGCLRGLQVDGAAEAVGRYTTRAVVNAIFMVITIDAIFSIIFSALRV